jgi:phospholipase C
MRLRIVFGVTAATALAAAGIAFSVGLPANGTPSKPTSVTVAAAGIHKIKHVIVIMQENRSFDSYFGHFPGAAGIPPGTCVPDPINGGCIKPFVDHKDANQGGPHADAAAVADENGGNMNGFVKQAELHCKGKPPCRTDVMGFHTKTDIPNYWAYAKNFVLSDHFFESEHTWSLPAHLSMVSAWTANCKTANPMSCVGTDSPRDRTPARPRPFAWTDLTWLLNRNHVSWGYFLDGGAGSGGVPTIWNPLPGFGDVHRDGQTANIRPLAGFLSEAAAGTLPAVSWIVPKPADSEHPAALVSRGQAYVTRIINAVMRSKDWKSTAIFLSWDDWGGFYDNVVPPNKDPLGYGFRVPNIVISPYAKRGFVDHAVSSSDSYLKFIEDDFLGGARLNPVTDGRPDSRTVVRENLTDNLLQDFNFNQPARAPLILIPCPPTTLTPKPKPGCNGNVALNFKSWGDS